MPRVCVFDVNETLLDLGALDPHFQQVFGDTGARRSWFQQVLQSAWVATITGTYADFSTIGQAALTMIAERQGIELGDEARGLILDAVGRLPAHPDVRPALDNLRSAGLRIAALTNSTEQVARAQFANADLYTYFEQILSVDAVKQFKPSADVYRMAAARLNVEMDQVRLIAAHAWDVTGAIRAGCAAAFVGRPGQVLDPQGERPDIIGRDLREVAEQIVAVEVGAGH